MCTDIHTYPKGGACPAFFGTVIVSGREVAGPLSIVGMAFQNPTLLPWRTALDNVMLPMVYAGVSGSIRRQRGLAALDAVGLADRAHHRPNEMSGGQQQRVAIARALVNAPSLILADEPTGNLDSRTSVEIMAILQRLNREKRITIILITHEHDIAEYAHREVTFRDGRVVSDRLVEKRRDAAGERAALPEEEAVT